MLHAPLSRTMPATMSRCSCQRRLSAGHLLSSRARCCLGSSGVEPATWCTGSLIFSLCSCMRWSQERIPRRIAAVCRCMESLENAPCRPPALAVAEAFPCAMANLSSNRTAASRMQASFFYCTLQGATRQGRSTVPHPPPSRGREHVGALAAKFVPHSIGLPPRRGEGANSLVQSGENRALHSPALMVHPQPWLLPRAPHPSHPALGAASLPLAAVQVGTRRARCGGAGSSSRDHHLAPSALRRPAAARPVSLLPV